MAYGNFAILLFLMQRVMDYLLALQDFYCRRFFGHRRSIMPKSNEVAYTIIMLPEAKRFMYLSCLPFSFRKRISVLNFFFDHNVRYGSSVTFRIGVASVSLQNLDNHEPHRFDFCDECKPTE